MAESENKRFIVDHMLIKLGKYLRILGYDAQWDCAVRTHELILRSNRESRVFVTRNTKIDDQYPRPTEVVHILSHDPVEQLQEVVNEFGLNVESLVFSRCVRCNAILLRASKKEAEQAVHPNVFRRYSVFYKCPECGEIFWRGSHVRNTCRKLGIRNLCDLDD
ncbi:MAG: Mut7-C RNAse domain-containing protein [Lentisphaerae bacterium]|nr:Mut7-C RNAse domain-containing protein [Lentisphaerota bacterium]